MHLLVLAALTAATGNAVTARRIASQLQTAHQVTLVDANDTSVPELRALVAREKIDAALGVHALLAGPFLAPLKIPYALVFGGTDLYEQVHELQQAQMARAALNATQVIAFSPENRARAEWMWPALAGRVELLPQAVEIPPPDPSFSLRGRLGLGASDVLVVLPTGIRRVKDPLHVVDALSVWHVLRPRIHLVVAGAVLEPDYAEEALSVLAERLGIHYLSALPRPAMLSAIREADVVINTSLSEGMCGVLLEAMRLGTPVVARRNAGNESLVVHGHTGLLYDSPRELVQWINALVASGELRNRLARTAQQKAETTHSMDREREAYLAIASNLAELTRPSQVPAALPLDELTQALPAASRIALDAETTDALRALIAKIHEDPALKKTQRELSGLLGTAPPSVAIAEIRAAALERRLGVANGRAFHLLLALLQIPAVEARHEARGIGRDITLATLSDLTLWARKLHQQTGQPGITVELLAWAQRYLRGELLQVGPLQFDLRPFPGPLRVFRHRKTRRVVAESLDGRALDLVKGIVTDDPTGTHDPAAWELALEPGSPVLEMWIPANTLVTLETVAASTKHAYALFARLAPETVPLAVCGESWRLDPQVAEFLPPELGIAAFQKACSLYPSALPEAKTIRRLFGPDVERSQLASLPREKMDPMQQCVADFLAMPGTSLRARCGFVLREDAEAMPAWRAQQDPERAPSSAGAETAR